MTRTITYGELMAAVREDCQWGLVYLPGGGSEEWHTEAERRDSIRIWGGRKVQRCKPWAYSMFIWLE